MIKIPNTSATISNEFIADQLDEVARLLESQGANTFRVRAYRNAARTIRDLPTSAASIVRREGRSGLRKLPGIGESLGRAIHNLVHTGRLFLLDRLRGEMEPARLFATVATIGPEMARRIHETLGIETLAELEAAALDGRLSRVGGVGRKRIQAVRESLAGRFRRRPLSPSRRSGPNSHSVAELLDIDSEYRRLDRLNQLPRIAPRRLNPTGEAWLPILHTTRGERHYTALYSNTARAHELGTTRDWVVIYRDDQQGDGQWTVITSRVGKLKGRRIVRGREHECAEYYSIPTPST